jgi:hypothetical protein
MSQHTFQAVTNTTYWKYLKHPPADSEGNNCAVQHCATGSPPNQQHYTVNTRLTFDFGSYLEGKIATNVKFAIRIGTGLGMVEDTWNGEPVYFKITPGSSLAVVQAQNGSTVYIDNIPLSTEYWLDLVDISGDTIPPDYDNQTRMIGLYNISSGSPPSLIVDYEDLAPHIAASGGGISQQLGGGGPSKGTGLIAAPDPPTIDRPEAYEKIVLISSKLKRTVLRNNVGKILHRNDGQKLYVR